MHFILRASDNASVKRKHRYSIFKTTILKLIPSYLTISINVCRCAVVRFRLTKISTLKVCNNKLIKLIINIPSFY